MPFNSLLRSLFLFVLLVSCASILAEELSPQQKQYREQIETILDSEPFNEIELRSGWRPKNITESNDEIPQWLINFVEWLEGFDGGERDFSNSIQTIALIIEIIFWLIFIGLILYLLYRFRGAIGRGIRVFYKPKVDDVPVTIAGLNVSKESLPDDVVQTAKTLWAEKQYRQAVGLLYRASLSHLLHDYQCPLLSSFTEQECLDTASALPNSALVELMQVLTQSWQQLAYAHQIPSAEQFQLCCMRWAQVFVSDSGEVNDEG